MNSTEDGGDSHSLVVEWYVVVSVVLSVVFLFLIVYQCSYRVKLNKRKIHNLISETSTS